LFVGADCRRLARGHRTRIVNHNAHSGEIKKVTLFSLCSRAFQAAATSRLAKVPDTYGNACHLFLLLLTDMALTMRNATCGPNVNADIVHNTNVPMHISKSRCDSSFRSSHTLTVYEDCECNGDIVGMTPLTLEVPQVIIILRCKIGGTVRFDWNPSTPGAIQNIVLIDTATTLGSAPVGCTVRTI
jgi:hypothetical protein